MTTVFDPLLKNYIPAEAYTYLNAINTISSLSMRGQNKEIQQFIAALSVYLRYLFTNNHQRTTIETEIDHAVAYIRLQRIRFPGLIFYYADVEEDVRDVPVQKLLIQTFVENIFKHAFDGKQTLSIFLRVQHTLLGAVPCAKVTIEDTGCGFTEEFLADFPPQNGEKVGLAVDQLFEKYPAGVASTYLQMFQNQTPEGWEALDYVLQNDPRITVR